MPKLTLRLHQSFEVQVSSIESTRNKMEILFQNGHINVSDIQHVYAGLYLELFTDFEALLENLFFGLLNGRLFTRTYPVLKKATIAPVTELKNIVQSGKSYVAWLPYNDNTLKRAKLYINSGEPFCRINQVEIQKITDYHNIRNAIAHKSENSYEKFNLIIKDLTLLESEKTPTGYLRSKPSNTQTQFEIAAIELKILTNTLCA